MDHSLALSAQSSDPQDLEDAFAQEVARQCADPQHADAARIEAFAAPIFSLDQSRQEAAMNNLLYNAVNALQQLGSGRYPKDWHIRLIAFALDHGADPNTQWHSSKDDALICPVKKILSEPSSINSLRALDLLLARGAFHTWNSNRDAALDIAVSNNLVDAADILITHGADMYRRGLGGSRPIDQVIKNSNIEMLRVFIDQGLDVNFTGQDDLTLFQRALLAVGVAPEQKKEFLECLLKAGADPNRGENGMAWSAALAPKNLKFLPLLVEYGAKLDREENQKMRPIFHTLVYYNKAHGVHADIDDVVYAIDALLEMGADPEEHDHSHQTAYQAAASRGFDEVSRMIRGAVARREALSIESQTQTVAVPPRQIRL